MKKARSTYFCIDIEANGPAPGLYDLVSIGATVVHAHEGGRYSTGESFYLEFTPTAPRVDPEAEAIHGLSRAHLMAHGVSLEEGCAKLSEWVAALTAAGTKAVFVGHNAVFDWSFIAWAYASLEQPNPFGYKAICTKSLAAGVLHLDWLDTGKEILADRLGLPPEDTSKKHRADYDAHYQAELLIKLLNLQEERHEHS